MHKAVLDYVIIRFEIPGLPLNGKVGAYNFASPLPSRHPVAHFTQLDNDLLPEPSKLRKMDLHELQSQLALWLDEASYIFQKVPGSAVLIRYVRSSYQNDPVRSAIELVLVIFFIRYLLSPSYSTSKQNFIKLREDVSFTPCL